MNNQHELKETTLSETIDADYILEIKDDSMAGDGIRKGDLAFIKKMPVVDHGFIAAVVLDGVATLRRVFIEDDGYRLSASNSEYIPRLTKDDVVLGEFMGLFKKAQHQEPISLAAARFKAAVKDLEPEEAAVAAYFIWADMVLDGTLPNPARHNEFFLKHSSGMEDSRIAGEFRAFVGGMDFAFYSNTDSALEIGEAGCR